MGVWGGGWKLVRTNTLHRAVHVSSVIGSCLGVQSKLD